MELKLLFSSSYHQQTDGQSKVASRSLGNLLRNLIGDNAITSPGEVCL